MSFGERLKAARKIQKLTQAQLAEQLGYGGTTISEYEQGNNKPSLDVFIQICRLLNQNANYFLQDHVECIEPQLNPEDQDLIDKYKALTSHDKSIVNYILNMENTSLQNTQLSDNVIRLIDMGEIIYIDTHLQPVSAGKGNIYIDDTPVSKLYPSTPVSSKADYCVRISGDSMYPDYLDGDTVYVVEDIPKHNDIGIFLYNGEAYCKKYYEKEGVKKLISLNSDQEKYAPIVIENDSFAAQGRVIGKFHAD